MELKDVKIGMWLEELMPIPQRYTPPMQVTGIFKGFSPDNDTLYLEFEDHEGDPFECHPRDCRPVNPREPFIFYPPSILPEKDVSVLVEYRLHDSEPSDPSDWTFSHVPADPAKTITNPQGFAFYIEGAIIMRWCYLPEGNEK